MTVDVKTGGISAGGKGRANPSGSQANPSGGEAKSVSGGDLGEGVGLTDIANLTDEQVLALYAFPPGPWVRMNFVASADGAATLGGVSGELGDAQDQRLLGLLRRPADAVMVGSGTLRAEGYGGLRLGEAAVAWRRARGLADHPRLVVVTRSLALDPGAAFFVDAPAKPLVVTCEDGLAGRVGGFDSVAEVVACGRSSVDPGMVVTALAERGLYAINGEGGPRVFGQFVAAGAVDELCLTVGPWLVAGGAPRIAVGVGEFPSRLELVNALSHGSELFLRYFVRR